MASERDASRSAWWKFGSQVITTSSEIKENNFEGVLSRASIPETIATGVNEECGLDPKWINMKWWQVGMVMIVSDTMSTPNT